MLKSYLLIFLIGLQTAWMGLSGQISSEQVVPRSAEETNFSASQLEVAKLEITDSVDKGEDYQKKIEKLGITLHPGTDFDSNSKGNPISLNHCAELVYQTLKVMPEKTVSKVKNLTLYFNSTGRRGLGGGSTIILRCQNVTDQELVSVLVHELGHIEDTAVMKGDFWAGESEFKDGKNSVYNNDASLGFYRISFENDKKLKTEAVDTDFVSGYAKTDPYEDFAESYNFYLLHGEEFRQMSERTPALAQKYSFLKDNVFGGKEFGLQSSSVFALSDERNYDTTVLEYDLKNFLAI